MSFPRKRESTTVAERLDSRLRGNDVTEKKDGIRSDYGDHQLPRRDQPGALRGDEARPVHGRLRRGRGALRGIVQGHPRAAEGVRLEARLRHADLGSGHRRHGDRPGDGRHAPRARTDDRQFRLPRDGPDPEPHGAHALHVRRAGQAADHHPHARRRRAPARQPALAQPGGPLRPYAGPESRLSRHARGREGAAQGRHPRR